jgi:hypothetical protein
MTDWRNIHQHETRDDGDVADRISQKTPTFADSGYDGMQTFDQSLLQLHREELITYETARDAATNPDDFDLKVKGILSTGEMTWDAASGAAPPAAPMSLSPAEAESSPFRKR